MFNKQPGEYIQNWRFGDYVKNDDSDAWRLNGEFGPIKEFKFYHSLAKAHEKKARDENYKSRT